MKTSAQIKAEIQETHVAINDHIVHGCGHEGNGYARILQFNAILMNLHSELAEVSSVRLENQTKKLISLTNALVGFTIGLFILTVVLAGFTWVLVMHEH